MGTSGPLPASQVEEKPEEKKQAAQEEKTENSAPASHPPLDIRNIVDKTAQLVVKNGTEFEKRILANSIGNVKFNFLSSSDPYHAYYQHRMAEFRSQLQSSAQQPAGSQPSESASELGEAAPLADSNEAPKIDCQAQFKPVHKMLEPPETERYTVRLPEGITGEELDIIKLTAQFVPRNGKSSFLTGLG